MKKILFTIILSLGLSFFYLSNTFSQSSELENFRIAYPFDKSEIINNQKIIWQVDFETNLDYRIKLYSSTCSDPENTFVGTISSGKYTQESKTEGGLYEFDWNLSKPFIDNISLKNGSYCLAIEVNIDNDLSQTFEAYKDIQIVDNGSATPIIKKDSLKTIITEGESYEFDVEAEDSDSEKLTYSFESAPDFLTINSENGIITSKDKVTQYGSYIVSILVKDESGNSDILTYNLNIIRNLSSLTENSIKISTPSILLFNNSNSEIGIELESGVNFEEMFLSFSKDGKVFSQFFSGKVAPNFKLPYNIIEPGEYTLRINYKDKNGVFFGKIITFYIAKESEFNVRTIPSIYDLEPLDGANILSNPPIISGKISIQESLENNEFDLKVFLNDEDISDSCQFEEEIFECILREEISVGANKLKFEVRDSQNNLNSKSVVFSIGGSDSPNDPNVVNKDTINLFGTEFSTGILAVAVILVVLGIIVILIPWFIFSLWIKRSRKKDYYTLNSENYNNTYNAPPISPTIGEQSQNFTPVQPVQEYQKSPNPYDIGTQEITGEVPNIAQAQEVYTSPIFQPIVTPTLPTSYTDNDIPDWLKDDSSGSNPIGIKGQSIEPPKPIKGDQPYGVTDSPGDDF